MESINDQMGNVITITVPSGMEYTIREQNGADDDIISNPVAAKDLSNIDNFLAAIVVSPKITAKAAAQLPVLDRMCILLNSRIFSLGNEFIFSYKWENGQEEFYKQDLMEFLLPYWEEPTEEELNSKPYAIPYYPQPELGMSKIPFTTSSGKYIEFDRMTGMSEKMAISVPEHQRTKNLELVIRNLHLQVDSKMERVTNFALFSVKDMQEIRQFVFSLDPVWGGTCEIEQEGTGVKLEVPIVGMDGFFFQGAM